MSGTGQFATNFESLAPKKSRDIGMRNRLKNTDQRIVITVNYSPWCKMPHFYTRQNDIFHGKIAPTC